jgi:hypothetical protein
MIGPPGLPKIGRRTSRRAAPRPDRLRVPLLACKWTVCFYFAGVLAHFAHHMAFDLPAGTDPSFQVALASAPISLAWPADLIGTLLTLA